MVSPTVILFLLNKCPLKDYNPCQFGIRYFLPSLKNIADGAWNQDGGVAIASLDKN
ncbi:hypothetical protein JYQ62_00020 [Nostoc sp. UHCC 0702]|nr:hypothetical protein JYQ62_00020 [Nostoc sp. UHCC 0702]